MTSPTDSPSRGIGLSYDFTPGPAGAPTLLFVHAGVCDRRMWDAQLAALAPRAAVIRVDLRGFGASDRDAEGWTHVDDVIGVLDGEGVSAVHVVAASFGSGVGIQLAQRCPERVRSLVLAPPGGAMLLTMTPALREFVDAERKALAADDIDAAVEENIKAWVLGTGRDETDIPDGVADGVRLMQRRAFELAGRIGEPADVDDEPFERASQVSAPTLMIVGTLDMDATADAARKWSNVLPTAVVEPWDDVAHLPSMERPERFNERLTAWLNQHHH